jgi:hypothetical protein
MQVQTAVQKPETFNSIAVPPRQEDPAESIEGQLQKLVDKYWAMGRPSRARRHFIWSQAELFSKGIHFFHYNAQRGTYAEWPQKDQDIYSPVPLVQYAVEMIAAAYSKSKPRVAPATQGDRQQERVVNRALQDVADGYFDKFYLANPEDRQREAKLAPLRDIVFVLLEYDLTAGPQMQVPVLQPQEQAFGQIGCPGCGAQYDAADAQLSTAQQAMGLGQEQCPGCVGQLDTSGVQKVMGIAQAGTQAIRQGEVKRTVLDGFQVDAYERRFSIHDSPYVRIDEILFTEEAQEMYPYVEIKGNASLGRFDLGYNGLHTLRQLECLVSNTGQMDQSKPDALAGYLGSYLEDSKCLRSRVFLKSSALAKIVVGAAIGSQLPGTNDVLPKGTKLSDVYPAGAVLHLINDKIVKVESRARYRLCAYKYSIPGSGLYGTGVAPLVSLNKAYDELTSYELQWALMASLGITLVDERIGGFTNKPGKHYYVPQEAVPFDKPLSQLISWQQAGAMPPSVENLRQSFKNDLASLSMAPNPNAEGMSPAAISTATGVNYQSQVTNAIIAPKLELFAASAAEQIQYAVELESKFNQAPRPFAFKKFGKSITTEFDFLQLQEVPNFIVEEDSHQPRTQVERRQDAMAFISAGGGQGKLAPHVEENLAKEFQQPIGADDYDEWSVKAQNRLEALKRAEPMVTNAPPEMLAAASMELAASGLPPTPDMVLIKLAKAEPQPLDNNGMFVRFYTEEVYLSDEWDELSDLLQQAIFTLWQLHHQNEAMKMQQQTALQVAASAPAQAAQQEAENAKGEQVQASEQNKQQDAAASRDHEATEADKDRQHEQRMQKDSHAHDEKMAKFQRAKPVKK